MILNILTNLKFQERITPEILKWANLRGLNLVTIKSGAIFDADDTCECEHCHTLHASDDCDSVRTGRRDNAEEWCESCRDDDSFRCGDCGDKFNNDCSCGENLNDETVCERCGDNYFTCEGCDGHFHNDDYGEDGHCQGCCDSENDCRVIRDYSTDVDLNFHGKGPYYFGVELEIESPKNREENAERVNSLVSDFAILKDDGSLDNGFEIVTEPATLEKQIELWQPFFDKHPAGLKSFETSSCGLHVHCSRKPLSELTIAKIVCFVNASHNRNFMEIIAGRPAGKWAKYHAKRMADGNKLNPERYEAVNLQNSNSIEFRIFKGTLKKESVFKAIEFCAALIKFSLPANRSLKDSISRVQFCEFVKRNRKDYPHLAAFISAKWNGVETRASANFKFSVVNRRIELADAEITNDNQN